MLYVSEEKSMLAGIGMKISNFFKPIGLADCRITTAIIIGISAKEAILSTLSVLYNSNLSTLAETINIIFTKRVALSFITFISLYTPCIATIGVIKKEFGIKKAIKTVFTQFFIAYIASFLIYHLIKFIRESRSGQLVKGIIVILIAYFLMVLLLHYY